MPCLIVIVALFAPRLTIFFIWLFTNWLDQAYETRLWPLLGFLFMPYTTLGYLAAMLNTNGHISGGWLALVVICALTDLGAWGGSRKVRRRSANT